MIRSFHRVVLVAILATALARIALAEEKSSPSSSAIKDPYSVPQTDDVAMLAEFIEGIVKDRPTSAAGAMALESKMSGVMEAANRILVLEKDVNSKAYRLAKRLVLRRTDIRKAAQQGTAVQRREFLDELLTFLRASDKAEEDAWLARQYATSLEYGDGRELAPEAYARFGQLLETSPDEKAARIGKTMLGATRRLKLVGEPMELKGMTLAGEPFDLASLRGKVVLIEFWATWCGPCVAEHPNIEQQYRMRKEKGFEVVGWSIDDDPAELKAFVASRHIPWIILHDRQHAKQPQPTVDYGIFGVPTMFLVDRDGKVVSTMARGAELTRLLDELLETGG